MNWGLQWLASKVATDATISDYVEKLKTIKSEINIWKRLQYNTLPWRNTPPWLKSVQGQWFPMDFYKNLYYGWSSIFLP